MEILKIKKVRGNAKLPTRATSGSAGLDLYACIEEPITLNKGDKALIPTGIALGLDAPHYAAFIHSRSGLAIKHGLALLNSVGVVDSDYRGEVCVGIIKLTEEPYTIQPFERIAQMVIKPVELPEIVEVEEEVYIKPDVTAQKFYLTNRKPDKWKNDTKDLGSAGDENNTGVVMLPEIEEPEEHPVIEADIVEE